MLYKDRILLISTIKLYHKLINKYITIYTKDNKNDKDNSTGGKDKVNANKGNKDTKNNTTNNITKESINKISKLKDMINNYTTTINNIIDNNNYKEDIHNLIEEHLLFYQYYNTYKCYKEYRYNNNNDISNRDDDNNSMNRDNNNNKDDNNDNDNDNNTITNNHNNITTNNNNTTNNDNIEYKYFKDEIEEDILKGNFNSLLKFMEDNKNIDKYFIPIIYYNKDNNINKNVDDINDVDDNTINNDLITIITNNNNNINNTLSLPYNNINNSNKKYYTVIDLNNIIKIQSFIKLIDYNNINNVINYLIDNDMYDIIKDYIFLLVPGLVDIIFYNTNDNKLYGNNLYDSNTKIYDSNNTTITNNHTNNYNKNTAIEHIMVNNYKKIIFIYRMLKYKIDGYNYRSRLCNRVMIGIIAIRNINCNKDNRYINKNIEELCTLTYGNHHTNNNYYKDIDDNYSKDNITIDNNHAITTDDNHAITDNTIDVCYYFDNAYNRELLCPTCIPWLDVSLPYNNIGNSILICNGTGRIINDNCLPYILDSRYIYSDEYIKNSRLCVVSGKWSIGEPTVCYFI